MIDYEEVEQSICDVLCPKAENGDSINKIYSAIPVPDNTSELTRLFTQTKVTIAYVGSDYGEDESTSCVIQEETVTFEAIIRSKTRKGTEGIFAVERDIRTKLLGYRLPVAQKKITFIKSGYIDGSTQNDWNYMMSFSFRTKAVDEQPEETGPFAKQIDLN
ncbi:MAG: Gp37 family protein [Bacteroidota bacterium]|nr:Gp37 family protein [Bacteroidota bacterium]